MTSQPLETAFTMDTSSIKYGPGVTREVGFDMKNLGARRALLVTDPNLADSEPVKVAMEWRYVTIAVGIEDAQLDWVYADRFGDLGHTTGQGSASIGVKEKVFRHALSLSRFLGSTADGLPF